MSDDLAKVVKVIDAFRVVINRGRADGVSSGDRYLVYQIGEELTDPDTEESLGRVEIVKGGGEVTHVQERMATVESYRTERVAVRAPFAGVLAPTEYEQRKIPYDDPKVGDVARVTKRRGAA